mmetsp:Transcript_7557/g.12589  ORF Transcript_7557/g.12589 Transcript_7557/m.12589 type:complete len:114 (+) Transcript_7557:560-901(+)
MLVSGSEEVDKKKKLAKNTTANPLSLGKFRCTAKQVQGIKCCIVVPRNKSNSKTAVQTPYLYETAKKAAELDGNTLAKSSIQQQQQHEQQAPRQPKAQKSSAMQSGQRISLEI